MKSVFITGANAGLGKESARQLALHSTIDTIYLGCRNLDKAHIAKRELTESTGRDIFKIVHIDASDLSSVRHAVTQLPETVDGLVMNAGGTGGEHFYKKNEDGVTQIFAVNVLGHVVLMDELLKSNKLKQTAVYVGSEAARGVKEMGMKRPKLTHSSVDEFTEICQGHLFSSTKDATVPYGPVKYMAALWMAAIAREYPNLRLITMSPGATTGTEGFNTLSFLKQYIMKGMMQVMLMLSRVHKLEIGANRLVDGLLNDKYKSGGFFASAKGLTGPIIEQSKLFSDLSNTQVQDNAKAAIYRFIS